MLGELLSAARLGRGRCWGLGRGQRDDGAVRAADAFAE